MKRLLLLFFFLLCAITAHAQTLTVSSFQYPNMNGYPGTTGTIRYYYTGCSGQQFIASDGAIVPCGVIGSDSGAYQIATFTISGTTLQVPSTTLPTTDDSSTPSVTLTAVFFDETGAQRDFLFSQWVVPDSLGPATTFALLSTFNRTVTIPNPPNNFYTAAQVNQILAGLGTAPYASDVIAGRSKLSAAPVSSINPIAVGDNDPRLGRLFNIAAYGAVCDGSTNDTVAINLAAAAAALLGGSIYLPPSTGGCVIGTATISVNVVSDGGAFKLTTGQTTTFTRNISAPLSILFRNATAGQGTASFSGNAATQLIYPQWWGASPSASKSTNTTTFQATINAAAASSIPMYVPQGKYSVGSLTLPESPASMVFTMSGAGCVYNFKLGSVMQAQYGTILSFENTDGSDFLTYAPTAFQNPTIVIRDLAIVGPDTETPRTTVSGSGIVVTATGSNQAIPLIQMTNVRVSYFYGGTGLDIELAEHSVFTNVVSELNDVGFRFAVAFNANTMIGCIARQNATAGVWVDQSESNAWVGGVVESNEKTGWHGEGMITWVVSGTHFENNNSTSTANTYALELEATPVVGRLGGRNLFLRFVSCTFNGANDSIRLRSSGGDNNGITFDGAYTSGVTNPKIIIDSNSIGTRLIDFADPTTGDITDNGAETFIYWQGVAYNPPGSAAAPSQRFGTDRGFYNDTINNCVGLAAAGAVVGKICSTGVSVPIDKVLSVADGNVDAGMGFYATVDGPKVFGAAGVSFGISTVGTYAEKAKVTSGGLTVGTSGDAVAQIRIYGPTLTPASCAANTSAEQDFTVTGLSTSDKVILNGPAPVAGTGIVNVRVKSANTLSITFGNYTAGALTPTSGVYNIVAMR